MLNGKNCIITGANRGIGKAITKEFAMQGCNIWACTRCQNSEFEEYLRELSKKNGIWIEPVYFELTSEEEIKQGFKTIYNSKRPVDILINNAGIGNASLFQMTPVSTLRKVFEVDFFAVYILTQLVLKVMMRQKSGCIINMASIAGLDGSALDTAYGSAKAALISFTKSLATEVGGHGIRVNAIAPGPTETDMLNMYREELRANLKNRNAYGRFIEPEEIASIALFLASDQSSGVNGQVIRVDGGKSSI